MAAPMARGNLPGPLFPRLLLGLSVKMNLDGEALANQLSIIRLSLLSNRLNGVRRLTARAINPAAAD
jgi:hypothetical protein